MSRYTKGAKTRFIAPAYGKFESSSLQQRVREPSVPLWGKCPPWSPPLPSATDDEIQNLSISVRLRRSGRAVRMLIQGTGTFATAKPDARLVGLLIRARQFNATLLGSDGMPFATLAKALEVSRWSNFPARRDEAARPAETRRLLNITPAAGKVSVGRFSSTAVPARAVRRPWSPWCAKRVRVAAGLSDVTRLSSSVRLRLCQARSAARASQVADVKAPAASLRSDRAADGRRGWPR